MCVKAFNTENFLASKEGETMAIWTRMTCMALVYAALIGCGGKDLSQTPQMPQETEAPPNIQIGNAGFMSELGVVRVQWLKPESDAVQTYVLERKHDGGEYEPVVSASTNVLTSIGGILELRDTLVIAGEQATYRVGAMVSGKAYYSDAVQVTVPGASLELVELNQKTATVSLQWNTGGEQALSYEIVRQIDGTPPEIVYLTRNSTNTAFEDGPLPGNMRYSYQIQTILQSGSRLSSRKSNVGFYLNRIQTQLTSAQDAKMRLALVSASNNTTPPMICIFNHSDVEVIKGPGVAMENIALVGAYRPQVTLMEKESISFAGHTLHSGEHSEIFIVGLHSDTHAVVIQMYRIETDVWNPVPATWEPALQEWQIEADYRSTAVARNSDGRLFVAAGGLIKAFSIANIRVDGDEQKAKPIASGFVPIPGGGDIGDLEVTGNSIWLSLPNENRLLHGQIQFASDGSLQNIDWQTLSIPGVLSGPLTVNQHGNVLFLDLYNHKVWMMDSTGQIVTHINLSKTGFESSSGKDGDLIAGKSGSYDVLFVSNAAGQIAMFKTE